MAKKKTVTATGYKLDLRRRVGGEVYTFDLVVLVGDDEYTLRVDTMDENTSLIQKALRKLGDLWPACDLNVVVQGNEVVDVVM